MRGHEEISVSFDADPELRTPQQRRLSGFAPQPHFRPPMMPTAAVQSGSGSGLPFFSFDLASSTASLPPRVGRSSNNNGVSGGFQPFEDEAPLLEELGINPRQIVRKTLAVLHPFRADPHLHEDGDLSGPFVFVLLFGVCQLLSGKLHFGVTLGWGVLASLFLYAVFNLLAGRNGSLDLYRCCSLVGYCIIPMVLFSASSLFIPQGGALSFTLAFVTVIWCTRSCIRLLVALSPHADEHRLLVAYPCIVVYAAFALLVLF